MPDSFMTIGITDQSLHQIERFKRTLIQFAALTPAGREAATRLIAEELEKGIMKEFKPHDRTGRWDDPSVYIANYVHTVQTVELKHMGTFSRISIGGGAAFVQFGTPAHVITPVKHNVLFWKEEDGSWHRWKGGMHPGAKADDFVGRAMDKLDPAAALGGLFQHFIVTTSGSNP